MAIDPTIALMPIPTSDGSMTLYSEALGEVYHSRHGAVRESRHVFIDQGFRCTSADPLRILEVGLGTGLNALLTLESARTSERTVHYTALEPFPLQVEDALALDHIGKGIIRVERNVHERLLNATSGDPETLDERFRFRMLQIPFEQFIELSAFDLIYFDVFGPEHQPELWTEDIFRHVREVMRPGAILVTYCAKGAVRRSMVAAGLKVERLSGPPGKREMLRACRQET